jgi:multidrug efflux pump subunit AcrB
MVHFITQKRAQGESLDAAAREAGVARFRPILLTSLTTFAGLSPLLLETSMQARFLIPMAASLAFGVLFATFVTLMLVPVSYLILEDLRGLPAALGRLFSRAPRPAREARTLSSDPV